MDFVFCLAFLSSWFAERNLSYANVFRVQFCFVAFLFEALYIYYFASYWLYRELLAVCAFWMQYNMFVVVLCVVVVVVVTVTVTITVTVTVALLSLSLILPMCIRYFFLKSFFLLFKYWCVLFLIKYIFHEEN